LRAQESERRTGCEEARQSEDRMAEEEAAVAAPVDTVGEDAPAPDDVFVAQEAENQEHEQEEVEAAEEGEETEEGEPLPEGATVSESAALAAEQLMNLEAEQDEAGRAGTCTTLLLCVKTPIDATQRGPSMYVTNLVTPPGSACNPPSRAHGHKQQLMTTGIYSPCNQPDTREWRQPYPQSAQTTPSSRLSSPQRGRKSTPSCQSLWRARAQASSDSSQERDSIHPPPRRRRRRKRRSWRRRNGRWAPRC
jgi:hypothetical protein